MDFVVNEVKPMIDAGYRTLTDRENTALLGSSLGGLVSLWGAYAYPQVFKRVGGMSSTFDWGTFCPPTKHPLMSEIITSAGRQDFLIYIDSGGGPSGGDNYQTTLDVKNLLDSQGYVSGVDYSYYWDPNGTHDEAHWRARFDKPVRFWFHP
jgi:enterochelin esterase-like enzyme